MCADAEEMTKILLEVYGNKGQHRKIIMDTKAQIEASIKKTGHGMTQVVPIPAASLSAVACLFTLGYAAGFPVCRPFQSQFVAFARTHPNLLFPAFDIQATVRYFVSPRSAVVSLLDRSIGCAFFPVRDAVVRRGAT